MSTITVYKRKYRFDVLDAYDNDNGTKVQNKTNNLTDAYGNKYSDVITVALTNDGDPNTVDETTIKKLELYKAVTYQKGLGTRNVVIIKNDDINETTPRGLESFYEVTT